MPATVSRPTSRRHSFSRWPLSASTEGNAAILFDPRHDAWGFLVNTESRAG